MQGTTQVVVWPEAPSITLRCLDGVVHGKAVAKNRHKRFEQEGDSLEEFALKNPDKVAELTVKKSKRSYNNPDRIMPGARFLYKGKEYVLVAQKDNGFYYKGYGMEDFVKASECQIIKYNQGLVFVA